MAGSELWDEIEALEDEFVNGWPHLKDKEEIFRTSLEVQLLLAILNKLTAISNQLTYWDKHNVP